MSGAPADDEPGVRATLLQRIEYLAMRGAMAFAARLPEVLGYGLAGALGGLFVRLSARRRRYALRLLRNAFPGESDAKLLRFARQGTGNLLKVSLDVARLARFVDSGRLAERVDIRGYRELGLEPPWIGVTGHLGSWECGAAAAAILGHQVHVTARLMKNPLAQRWLKASRRRAGVVVHDRRGGIRGLARALQERCIAMQVVDQNQRLRGVFAPFFGELASCERAAATLALRKGYPIAVGASVRIGNGFRFRIDCETVLRPAPTGDHEADVLALVTAINRALEVLIRRHPEQYLWIHDRYRTRPPATGATASTAPPGDLDAEP